MSGLPAAPLPAQGALADGADAGTAAREASSRHFLTVLFADLCDSSGLAANVDAEIFADVLSGLRDVARDVVARHGGRITRIQGDGVLAVFGHPCPGEGDARCATEAAIDMRDAVQALRVAGLPRHLGRIGLHAGVHAGLVLVSAGDMERGSLDLVGDVPNTAARLCSLAQDGEICVSESALGPLAALFVGSEPHAVAIKGHAAPMRVRKITGRATLQRRFEASASKGLTGFVGRGAAWNALQLAWRRTLAGKPGSVLVSGQPGLGKTRLLEEFARECAAGNQAIVLRGDCESNLLAEPLQPFLQMLRAAVAAGTAATVSDGDPQRLGTAITDWVVGLAGSGRPVLIVLDDWQWADDASRQTLDLILALRAPVLTLVASRTLAQAALAGRVAEAVELAPLGPDETRAVVRHWLPAPDPFLVMEIHAYAGGIPLFIEELCHAAAFGNGLQPGLPGGGTAWLNALIESRVTRLDGELARLLRVAAVLGNAFPQWLLQRLTGCGAADPRLQSLAAQDFLFAGDQPGLLRFKHGITRDAVYATVGRAERQQLHRQVADILESARAEGSGDTALEALAYHTAAAGASSQAAGYAESAGDKAMASNALDRARDQYTAALRELDALPVLAEPDVLRWCRTAQKLGMACVFDPISIPDHARLLERAVEQAAQLGDANLQARAHYWLGYTRYAIGRARSGLAHTQQALALAVASGDPRLAAQVRATLGQTLVAICRYDEALPLLDGAIAAKRQGAAPGSNTAIGSAYTLAGKGLLLTDRGAFADADACFAEARALLGSSGHPVASSVCGLMGIALTWQGRWSDAVTIGDEAAAIADASRSRQLLAMGKAVAGYARWAAGGDSAGLDGVQEAVQWLEDRGGRFMVSLLYGWLVDAAVARGDRPQARRHAARLLLRARDGDRIGEAMGCRAMSRLALSDGHQGRAAAWLARADRSAAARQAPHEAAHNDIRRAALLRVAGAVQAAESAAANARALYGSLRMDWHADAAARSPPAS